MSGVDLDEDPPQRPRWFEPGRGREVETVEPEEFFEDVYLDDGDQAATRWKEQPVPPEPATLRMQFEVSRAKADEIKRLMQEGGFETQKEFFNNAVTLLKWALRHAQKGHAVSAVDPVANKQYELQMPFLAHAAPHPDRD